ncbi:MAG: tRNA uridine-5-carboxymethylaminomethyl(34) synthesis GTPase MnmE [Pseudomonadota bacterium]
MNLSQTGDTIAAIATAPGRGSIGIVRLSGPKSIELAAQISQKALKPRHAHYGDFFHPTSGELIDRGLILLFPAPHSFTGEDVLELQGHGGPVVMDSLLKALCSIDGVRIAKPGEFSERAFINDKMDLTQAEAIADLINANSEQAARNAVHSLQGVFSEQIAKLIEQLTQLRIYTEAAIDFPEEEIDFLQDTTLLDGVQSCSQQINSIIEQARQGVIRREGMTIVIAGKPNAGKSSLLNALSGRQSAIVTDIPGTTRDILREHIMLDDLPLHIIDTAGLREGGDTVERMGMARAWQEIAKADQILVVIDGSESQVKPIDKHRLETLLPGFSHEKAENRVDYSKITIIYNKSDLNPEPSRPPTPSAIPQLTLSAKTGQGLDLLCEHLKSTIGYQQTSEGNFTARRRHLEALGQAKEAIDQALQQLNKGAGELLAEELKQSQLALGEITGHISSDELLGKIFSSGNCRNHATSFVTQPYTFGRLPHPLQNDAPLTCRRRPGSTPRRIERWHLGHDRHRSCPPHRF